MLTSIRKSLNFASTSADDDERVKKSGKKVMTADLDVVVVVNPYSSGRFLVTELRRQGIPVVGIQSSVDLPISWTKHVPEP